MIVVWSVRIILFAAFFLFWQYGAGLVNWAFGPGTAGNWRFFVSSPTDVAAALVTLFTTGKIFPDIILTLVETLSAFAIGAALALLFGILLGASSCVTITLRPFIKVLDAVPRLVLMPVFLLAFGITIWSKIAFGAFLAFSVVLIEICERLVRLPTNDAGTPGAGPATSRWSTFLDAWITGLQPAMRFCFAGVVIGEYLGSSNGLGYQVVMAWQIFAISTMYAALVLLTVIAVMLDAFASKSSWTAIVACFGKYAVFKGRASRSDLWYFILFYVLTAFLVTALVGQTPIVLLAILLVLVLPTLAVQVRRLHDVGRPGAWFLIGFTGIGQFLLLYWFCRRGDPDTNQFGANPLRAA